MGKPNGKRLLGKPRSKSDNWNTYRILMGKPNGKRLLGKPRSR
jgi:hypothetical protein